MNTRLIRDELRVEVSENNQIVGGCILHSDQVDTDAKIAKILSEYMGKHPGKLVKVLRTVSMTEVLGQGSMRP